MSDNAASRSRGTCSECGKEVRISGSVRASRSGAPVPPLPPRTGPKRSLAARTGRLTPESATSATVRTFRSRCTGRISGSARNPARRSGAIAQDSRCSFAGGPERPPGWDQTRQLAKSRARHLRRAQTWDGITDEEILERDGWRCQIPGCKRRPIRKDAKHPHPRSASIDHIIPLSHGGDDVAANKRAAHLTCNVVRSNKVGDEQMALFGSLREAPLETRIAGTIRERRRRSDLCERSARGQPAAVRK